MTALLDLAIQTLRSLRAHSLRFLLTSLGIFWGALMLTYLSASSVGTEQSFKKKLERTGPKVVYAFPGSIVKERVGARGARALELEPPDVDRLEALDVVEQSSVELLLWNQIVRVGSRSRILTVIGMDWDGLAIRSFETEAGRPLSPRDVETAARVAYLGAEVRERLFGREPAVGRTLHIDGKPFRVIGVSKRKGDQLMYMGDADDWIVIVPYTSAQRWFTRDDRVTRYTVNPLTRWQSDEAITAIRSLTALHHHFSPDSELAMNFVDVQEIWQILDTLFIGLEVFLVGAGLVTLIVGAIGVMNIMLVVVAERVQEIGLRKALGASDRAIFSLFLSEAVAVSTASGIAGAGVGFLLIKLTRMALPGDDPLISAPIFDPQTTAAIVFALMVVGAIAGMIPALRAARVPPAESLRAL